MYTETVNYNNDYASNIKSNTNYFYNFNMIYLCLETGKYLKYFVRFIAS